jgi:hypothetical protein
MNPSSNAVLLAKKDWRKKAMMKRTYEHLKANEIFLLVK